MEGVSSLEDQAKLFIGKSRQQSYWAQDSLIRFMNIQRERARRGEISESTIPNYYKAAKLFCEMNDVVLNWKKILYGCFVQPKVMSNVFGASGVMSRYSPIFNISMKEYEDMAIKIGDKVGIEINKVESSGI
jgi:hypothetical protein